MIRQITATNGNVFTLHGFLENCTIKCRSGIRQAEKEPDETFIMKGIKNRSTPPSLRYINI